MFTDPLLIPTIDNMDQLGNADVFTSPVIDPGAIAGKTVRRITSGALDGTVTIAHSVSRENKPYGTDRVATRVDLGKVDANGVRVESFAIVILGHPKSGMTFAECDQAARHALSLVGFGTNNADTPITGANGVTFRTRLMGGEG